MVSRGALIDIIIIFSFTIEVKFGTLSYCSTRHCSLKSIKPKNRFLMELIVSKMFQLLVLGETLNLT